MVCIAILDLDVASKGGTEAEGLANSSRCAGVTLGTPGRDSAAGLFAK